MMAKLTIHKAVYNKWPARGQMPAGESYDLLCIDTSEPAEFRMEEMLFYRTKPEERHYFESGVGKLITVGITKIVHAEGGRAKFLGSIIPDKKQ